MYKLIAIVALICVASSTSTGFESIFAQSNATMGTAIQALVQMNMQDSSERLQEISDLLYEIQAIIDAQQSAADTHIEKTRTQCEADLTTYNTQLTNASNQLLDSQSEQSALEKEKTEKSSQLNTEKINHESCGNDLQQAFQDLTDEQSSFTEQSASFNDAITACEEAIRLLTQLSNGNATSFIQSGSRTSGIMFVQLSQRFADVKNVLEDNIKKGGPAAFVQPIIDVLTELGSQSKVDVGKVTQIIELIQTLLTRLREGLYERTIQNTTTVSDLENLIDTLSYQVNSAVNTCQILETRITEIETRLGELAGLIANQSDVTSAKITLIANTQNDCDEEETNYTTESNQRTSNLSLLTTLIEHFENQIVSAVSDVREGTLE